MPKVIGYAEDLGGGDPDWVCDPNARWVTAFSCETGTTANWGCITVNNGDVPQLNQFLTGASHITGTSPIIINNVSYPAQPVFWLIINIQPQNPSIGGHADFPTAYVPGSTVCGYECDPSGCNWTGLPTATYSTWNNCTIAFAAGLCSPPPLPDPTHYCTDYTCREIVYGGGALVGNQISAATAFSEIQSKTTTTPGSFSTAGMQGPFAYSDPGGVWDGFTTLAQMANTPGPNGVLSTPGQPTSNFSYSYTPLHYNVDDCINCCGDTDIQSYSNGTPSPYYGIGYSFTTPANTLYQTWLISSLGTYTGSSLTQTSWTFRNYMWTFGVNSCGFDWRCGPNCP
jgi:hypothetical protein